MMSLVENIKFQLASVVALFFVMVSWIYIFASHGLEHKIHAIGDDQASLVGFVLNNFAFVSTCMSGSGFSKTNHNKITTVPSFINELSRHVSIHRVISYPLVICIATYLIIGLLGAASFNTSTTSDILATLSASNENKVRISLISERLALT